MEPATPPTSPKPTFTEETPFKSSRGDEDLGTPESEHLRQQAIELMQELMEDGNSELTVTEKFKYVADTLQINSFRTVQTWYQRFLLKGHVVKQKPGRKVKMSDYHIEILFKISRLLMKSSTPLDWRMLTEMVCHCDHLFVTVFALSKDIVFHASLELFYNLNIESTLFSVYCF